MTLADLYEEYDAALWRYARTLAQDGDRADDLVQETFIRAMGHLGLLALLKPYQRRAWLYRTLKNLFLDEQRSYRRQERLVEQLGQEMPVEEFIPQEVTLTDPLRLVPERFRELVEKRYLRGMNSQEIAEELGIPAATVRSRLHLALKDLRGQGSE
jgi:RNA polymerase sigma-70 factor (ECF subfamily)